MSNVQDRQLESEILGVLAAEPNGVVVKELCRKLGRNPQELGSAFESLKREGAALGFAGLWYTPKEFGAAEERFRAGLSEINSEMPEVAYVSPEAICKRAGLRWIGKPLDRILARLVDESKLEWTEEGVRRPGFHIDLSPRQRALLDRVAQSLETQPVNTPNPFEIAAELRVPEQAVSEILRLGERAGRIVHVGTGVYYTVRQLEELGSRIAEMYGDRGFGATDLRDDLGTTRKYVTPLLEYFDSIGFTARVGGQRTVVRPEATNRG